MRIVIIGAGKIGYSLAEQLSKESHEIVIVDSDAGALNEAAHYLDVLTVCGNGAALEVQRRADTGTADLVIAATPSDEINLLCCILAKKLGCGSTILRMKNPEYTDQMDFLKDELGVSLIIDPERNTAREISRIVQFPSFLARDSFARGRAELLELKLTAESGICGKRIYELPRSLTDKLLICAVERGGNVLIPNGAFVLEEGDKIAVTASRKELARIIKELNISRIKIRSVIIIGGGSVGTYVATDLLNSGIFVKIIEQDAERCRYIAEKLPDALVINGDGTRQELLIEEGIADTDAVITLTGVDEENIITSLFASHAGARKTITKISRTELGSLFGDKGVGSVVNTKQQTVNEILRYVRSVNSSTGGSVKTLVRICGGKAEALEFEILPQTPHIGETLMSVKLKQNILICCISRGNKIIIPKGSDCLMTGDIVVVVTNADRPIYSISDIFADEDVQK